MFRSDNLIKPPQEHGNCMLLNGGVGDHVGSLVAVNYIIKTYPWINLLIWCPDFLVDFAKNVLPKGAIVRGFSQMRSHGYDHERTTISTQWDGRSSPMKRHHVDYAFGVLCDEAVSLEKKNYLRVNFDSIDFKKYKLPKDYVVICTGYTAKVREFNPEAVNGVIDYLLNKGITPVFLGQKQTETGTVHKIEGKFEATINYHLGINLIDKTSLLEAAKVMQYSKAVVGVDCGLIHIAGCTDVSIVAGFTTVSPELRAPIRADTLGYKFYPVTPDSSLACRFCQVKTNFLYGHDYKTCLYKDFLCVKQLTAAKFITELEKIL